MALWVLLARSAKLKVMIIQFDLSLISDLPTLTDSEWDALDLLARCHGEGKHLLMIERHLASRLASHRDKLSPYSQSIYNGLFQKASTSPLGSLDRIGNTILVCKDSAKPASGSRKDNQILVSLNWFSRSERIQPSHLICEHTSDCNVYIALAS
jgi:hypothetical protein